MKVKHEDTRRIVATVLCFVLISVGASFLPIAIGAIVILSALLTLLLITAYRLNRVRRDDMSKQLHEIQATLDLYTRENFRQRLPPMIGWAASPVLLSDITSEIRLRRPKLILELGSGVSTIVMAYALEELGSGRIVSLDHIADYRNRTIAELGRHGLESWVDVRLAPLKPVRLGGRDWSWYDVAALDGLNEIDFMVVDGPPFETQSMARYPALPLTMDRLSATAVIVLDDADRRDEQRCLKRWLEEFSDIDLELRASRKGTAILRRNAP